MANTIDPPELIVIKDISGSPDLSQWPADPFKVALPPEAEAGAVDWPTIECAVVGLPSIPDIHAAAALPQPGSAAAPGIVVSPGEAPALIPDPSASVAPLPLPSPAAAEMVVLPSADSAAAGTAVTPGIKGEMEIAGVSILLNAAYESGTDQGGLDFKGSTGAGQQIPIGTLIADLVNKFGGSINLPSAISDLTVENLGVSFNSETKNGSFTCALKDDGVSLIITIDLIKSGTATFGLIIEEEHFELSYDKSADVNNAQQILVATYRHSGKQRNIEIKSLVGDISTDIAALIPESLHIDLKDLLFVFSRNKTNKQSTFLFALDIGASISLSNLPLVGQEFTADKTVSVDALRLLVASQDLTAEVADLNPLIKPAGVATLPEAIPKGLTISATMNFGGSTKVLSMPIAPAADGSSSGNKSSSDKKSLSDNSKSSSDNSSSPSDNTKWFDLQKTFGPVYFDKVGVNYQEATLPPSSPPHPATLSFLLNAALTAAGLTLSLDGLSVGSPLDHFAPSVDLRGIGIDYQNGPVEIGAAFLRTQGVAEGGTKYDEYDGTAVIKTAEFTLSALGSYTKLDGHPSLFIYAFLDYPLGGPAFFFVTGLAAGFGYNRKLIVPSIDQVADFPLIKQAVGGKPDLGLTATLQALQTYIPPALGEIFLAVGIKFNSFKLIDSFALLTVEFGGPFVANILGLSTAIIPTPEPGKDVTPLAEVQIAWKATLDPEDGFLGVNAQLTPNSYILSKYCHLTGGYAFYSWFSGEHAGDFVQTLGGYHPSFAVPAHYPVVPRLAFLWRVSSDVTIKGDAYYALTGSALMAGGHLEVTFESGDLKAWLKLGADFLISWKPYHYDASVYVDIGVSYTFDINLLFAHIRQTISVDVGADLHLWGPDFSGTADIHLWIISFSISFGASASQTPEAIDWTTFKKSFLPADEKKVCSISVKDGLVRTMDGKTQEDVRWIINPKHFSLVVNSAVPFKSRAQQELNKTTGKWEMISVPLPATSFGIGSMEVISTDLDSAIAITITRDGGPADEDFHFEPVLKRIPPGLWGESLTPDLNGNTFIENVPTGIEITPSTPAKAGDTATIDLSKFKYASSYFPKGDDYPRDKSGFAYFWEPAASFVTSSESVSKNLVTNPLRDSLKTALNVSADISLRESVAKDFLRAPKIGNFSG